ncbi:MAG: hypothetical protein PHV34_13425 [Verrucomicrobiae bacterium]|nr:hypothetical protein [Verrucomicrobiae bacterium]
MENQKPHELVLAQAILNTPEEDNETPEQDPGGNPFKLVVDPALRFNLKQALIELIINHEEWLSQQIGDGKITLDSYKEYVELFARSLRETMETREGVAYLLRASGFKVDVKDINMSPAWRWTDKA